MMITESDNRGINYPDDADLLGAIRATFEAIDPVPAGLVDRIKATVAAGAAGALDAEFARLTSANYESLLAARGPEESRTVTFDSASLTIMIRIDSNPDGTTRVDGWLAPPQAHQVQMKLRNGSLNVTADEFGRFVFTSVPKGIVQLIVAYPEPDGDSHPEDRPAAPPKLVITPALTLLSSELANE
jgi:hypothetical protein